MGLLALSSSDSDEPSSHKLELNILPRISTLRKITQKGKSALQFKDIINNIKHTPRFKVSLVPFRDVPVQRTEAPKQHQSFPARTVFYRQGGSAHME